MTKVDFYISPDTDWEQSMKIACRVVEKAWRQRHQIYIHTPSESMMQALDELLWSFRPNSFIPHRQETEPAPRTPNTPDIVVACSGDPGMHHDVLVNMSEETPDFFGRFNRIAEIVHGEEQSKAKSRERYKYYRKRNFPLNVHQL